MHWRTLLAFILGLLVALSAWGCGDGAPDATSQWGGMSEEEWRKQYREKREAEKREEEAEAKKLAEAQQAARERKRAEREEEASADRAGYRAADSGKEVSRKPPTEGKAAAEDPEEPSDLTPLPATLAEWTEPDYLDARTQGAPELVAAVKRLGEQSVGDERTAELLAQLLAPPPEDANDATARRRRSSVYGKGRSGDLVEVIVAALGANGTGPARHVLVQLVCGQFETEDDRAAAQAAVRALVDNPCPENEDILFDLLTSEEAEPTQRRERSSTRWKAEPEQLRKLAFELLQPVATSSFRTRVARWMVDPATPSESQERFSKLVDRLHPEGFEANVVLLISNHTSPTTKLAIMEDFATCSSRALGHMLGFPEEQGDFPPDAAWRRRVTGQLWSKEFCGFLRRALERDAAFEESSKPIALAGTVPADSVRAALYRMLTRHWTDGPSALKSAGFPDELTADPGFLLMVQMLVHEEIPGARRSFTRSSSTRTSSVDRLHKLRAGQEAWQGGLQDVTEAWTEYLESLQAATSRRLFAASTRQGVADPAPTLSEDSPLDLPRLPFELHDGARIVAQYHLNWSDEFRETLAPVAADPIKIHYVRIDEETRLAKMLGTYRRRLKPCSERKVGEGTVLETLSTGVPLKRKRSIAVRIIPAMPEIPRLANQDQPLIVEVLSIEMHDPSDPGWRTASLTEN